MFKKLLLFILILILGIVGYYWYMFSRDGKGGGSGPKQAPVTLKIHSDTFNNSVDTALNAYLEMKTAFVDADTTAVVIACKKFILLLDSIPLDELKKDTTGIYETAQTFLGDIKANAASITKQLDITEMRKDFWQVSENLYPFFKTINYEGEKLYWQNCPMAFGDEKEANWLSRTYEVINPYLGKSHPEFKGTMLHCGSVKDSIMAEEKKP